MASTFRVRAKFLARVLAPILFATALSACSSVPDWVDPTTWVGGDSQASSDQTGDTGAGTDQSVAAGADQSAPSGPGAAQTSSAGQTPDIAAIPPKPTPPSTADEQKQVADSLAADRSQAHYSADQLRGGTEAAAPPPSAEAAAQAPASSGSSADSGTSTSPDSTPEAAAEASAPPDNQTAASPPPPPANAAAPAAAPPSNQVASTDTATTSAPAAAPMAAETAAPSTPGAPDMQATFAPSRAPALDPSVSQFVPQPIISHYRETAAAASVPVESSSAGPARHRHRKKIKTSQSVIHLHYAFRSEGRHVTVARANYSPRHRGGFLREAALTRSTTLSSSYGLDPALFAPAKRTAVAVVDFSRETTLLDIGARNRIQTAARNFTSKGGTGFVRVVGHASDLASNLPRAIRLRNNFERSEAQATAVARELIRDGVPARKVLVEAVGDRSGGGDHLAARAKRSAEIFLQS